jgi:hypothetical protein
MADEKKGLSTGAKVAIGVGVVGALGAIAAALAGGSSSGGNGGGRLRGSRSTPPVPTTSPRAKPPKFKGLKGGCGCGR